MTHIEEVGSYGVMVSTLDFESSDPSSNLGRTYHFYSQEVCIHCLIPLNLYQTVNRTPWRNGSASDSRSEGCVFESRRGQMILFYFLSLFFYIQSGQQIELQTQDV